MFDKLKVFLGLESEQEEYEDTFEYYMKKMKRLRRLYSKGEKTKDIKLCNEAIKRMYKLCENKGIKCLPGQSICDKCIFGFNTITLKSENKHEEDNLDRY